MRVAISFALIVMSFFLWVMPVTTAVYEFRTDQRTDTFTAATAIGQTSVNTTLVKSIYDDDTATLLISSSLAGDSPTYSSYNTTTRKLLTTGLTANTSRTLSVSYDAAALNSNALDTLFSWWPYLYYLIAIVFPIAGLVAIFTGR